MVTLKWILNCLSQDELFKYLFHCRPVLMFFCGDVGLLEKQLLEESKLLTVSCSLLIKSQMMLNYSSADTHVVVPLIWVNTWLIVQCGSHWCSRSLHCFDRIFLQRLNLVQCHTYTKRWRSTAGPWGVNPWTASAEMWNYCDFLLSWPVIPACYVRSPYYLHRKGQK